MMIRPQMGGGGPGSLRGGFLEGFTYGHPTNTYTKSFQIRTQIDPHPLKSMEIYGNPSKIIHHPVVRMIIL